MCMEIGSSGFTVLLRIDTLYMRMVCWYFVCY